MIRRRGIPRVVPGAMVVSAVAAATIVAGHDPADAAAYRYWTYWSAPATGSWLFSPVGPASSVPRDGAVEGWRFAVSTGTRGQGAQPRIPPAEAFQRFCGAVAPSGGTKRVAVVFDFGDTTDAPPGQTPPPSRGACAQVPTAGTGSQVLQSVADVRGEGGLVCGIGGYPVGECAPAVAQPTPVATATPANPPAKSTAPRAATPAPRSTPVAPSRVGTSPSRAARAVDSTSPTASADAPATASTPKGEPTKGGRGAGTPDSPAAPVPASPSPSTASVNPTPQFVAAEARSDEPAGPGPWLWVALVALLGLGGWAIRRAR